MSENPKDQQNPSPSDIIESEGGQAVTTISKEDFMPVLTVQDALDRYYQMNEVVSKVLVVDRDFGTIPGTNKPTLYKAGAEKLTTFFGLSPSFIPLETVQDWTGEEHYGEPFFNYRYKCQLKRGNLLIGEGVGSCNSWEAKFRFRNANLVCPHCEKEAVIKGKEEFGGGWLCWAKKGGCGEKWPDDAPEITEQEVGQVKNENPADIVNTLDKMAQKRALIAATLVACNASDFFTQDIEDMPASAIGGSPPPAVPTQGKTVSRSSADSIGNAKAMIAEGTFGGNDFLTLGKELGFDSGVVMEIKKQHEYKEGKNYLTDFASAANELILKYKEING